MRVIIAVITFLLLDAIWLGVIAKQLYIDNLGPLLRLNNNSITPLWLPAIIVYIALIAGIVLFVLPKANNQPVAALLWGALFGFITYATYDFTNLAVLSGWSWKISLIDTAWGMVICGVTSAVTILVMRWF